MDDTAEEKLDLKACDIEVCRICMATDVKLHSLQDTHLGFCMESIGGFTKSCEGLPNYVCYQCAPILIKCNKLIDKSKTTQTSLLEIFKTNGKITKPDIEAYKERKPSEPTLDSYLLLNYFYIKYDEENNTSDITKIGSDSDNKIIKNEVKEEISEEVTENDEHFIDSVLKQFIEIGKQDNDSESDVEAVEAPVPVIEIISDDEKMGDDFISLKSYVKVENPPVRGLFAKINDILPYREKKKVKRIGKPKKKGQKKKNTESLETTKNPAYESIMKRHFDVNVTPKNNKKYCCKSCPDTFQYIEDAKDHAIIGCQRSTRGTSESSAGSSNQLNSWKQWPGSSG